VPTRGGAPSASPVEGARTARLRAVESVSCPLDVVLVGVTGRVVTNCSSARGKERFVPTRRGAPSASASPVEGSRRRRRSRGHEQPFCAQKRALRAHSTWAYGGVTVEGSRTARLRAGENTSCLLEVGSRRCRRSSGHELLSCVPGRALRAHSTTGTGLTTRRRGTGRTTRRWGTGRTTRRRGTGRDGTNNARRAAARPRPRGSGGDAARRGSCRPIRRSGRRRRAWTDA
jgi:hypothetical protein